MADLAGDLFLLLLHDRSRRPLLGSASLGNELAAAVILDLVLAGRVSIASHGDPADPAPLLVRDASPTGDVVLDTALGRLATGGPTGTQQALELLAGGVRADVTGQLVEQGIIRRHDRKLLGILTRTAWPAVDPRRESAVRARLAAILLDDQEADPHTAVLLMLLLTVNAVHLVVNGYYKRVKARAEQVCSGDWAGEAERAAVRAVRRAIATIAIRANTRGTGSAGSAGGAGG
jgi:hypothetical protein